MYQKLRESLIGRIVVIIFFAVFRFTDISAGISYGKEVALLGLTLTVVDTSIMIIKKLYSEK